MTITHQDIAARFTELDAEHERLVARIYKERESLRELCAGTGHQLGEPREIVSATIADGPTAEYVLRHYMAADCKICGAKVETGGVAHDDNVNWWIPLSADLTGASFQRAPSSPAQAGRWLALSDGTSLSPSAFCRSPSRTESESPCEAASPVASTPDGAEQQ